MEGVVLAGGASQPGSSMNTTTPRPRAQASATAIQTPETTACVRTPMGTEGGVGASLLDPLFAGCTLDMGPDVPTYCWGAGSGELAGGGVTTTGGNPVSLTKSSRNVLRH